MHRTLDAGWGAGATMLRTATFTLIHSTAEYYTPNWFHSAHTHVIDPVTNDALHTVTGCLRPTTADNLPILAGIQPAEFCHKTAILSLARRAMEPGHLLHSVSGNAWRLKSRHPFVPAASQKLIRSSDYKDRRVAV